MEDSELERLMRDIESDRTERKASLAHPELVAEAICAFSNDLPDNRRPGIVYVGANDEGTCSRLPITDELLRAIADMARNGNIHPFPHMVVQRRTIAGCTLAIVIVEPHYYPPVQFRGRTCIRIGPRRGYATPDEERRLIERRRAANIPFELQPVPRATIADMDIDWFRREYLPMVLPTEVISRNSRTVEMQLAALRFMTIEGGPTVAGLIVLSGDPASFIPGAYLQFVRFEGNDLASPIKNQREVHGRLVDVLRLTDELIEANISVATEITTQPLEIRHPDYPVSALQQFTRNAISHRTYDGTSAPVRLHWFTDRIEISNPGGPYGQVNRENFGRPGIADYRNPRLAEVMKELGYIQRFGVGI